MDRLARCFLIYATLGFSLGVYAKDGQKKILIDKWDKTPDQKTITDLINESNLVIRGKLVDLKYSSSTDAIPYTFATYRIDETLKGKFYSNKIVLRFIGGQGDDGTHLSVSNIPNFKVAEDAFLMITSNDNKQCPLAGCNRGYFQTINEKVIGAAGNRISSNRNGIMLINGHYGDQEISATPFAKRVKKIARKGLKDGLTKRNRTISSANINEPFTGLKFEAAPPPDIYEVRKDPNFKPPKNYDKEISAYDKWEFEQLKANDWNPVIKAKFTNTDK